MSVIIINVTVSLINKLLSKYVLRASMYTVAYLYCPSLFSLRNKIILQKAKSESIFLFHDGLIDSASSRVWF
jgi:hypothetical protein